MTSVLSDLRDFNNNCDKLPEITNSYAGIVDSFVLRLEAILDKPEIILRKPHIVDDTRSIIKELKRTRIHAGKLDHSTHGPSDVPYGGQYIIYYDKFNRKGFLDLFKRIDLFLMEHEK